MLHEFLFEGLMLVRETAFAGVDSQAASETAVTGSARVIGFVAITILGLALGALLGLIVGVVTGLIPFMVC